jgi:hypothetical protein
LREQISWVEHAEVTVRMNQVRVARAEARTTDAISSEVVAHGSFRRIQDQCMQEWTNSGTPVPAIREAQFMLGTPLVGWGGTIEALPAPPASSSHRATDSDCSRGSCSTAPREWKPRGRG